MIIAIAKELKRHAPFTMLGALTGIAITVVVVYAQVPRSVSVGLFWCLHPFHVFLSALVTAAMYRLHSEGKPWATILVGYFGCIAVATLSDCVIPYLGEWMLDLPNRGIHLGFIETWWLVNPLAAVGIAVAYFWPKTRFPHAGHVLLSTWASLFHMTMALRVGEDVGLLTLIVIPIFLFLAVWIPCCTSDIVFPLLFSRKESHAMQIAIASGKGGTGKTTVATNLAHVASCNGQSVIYLDCDVEEPNGHIFLKPEITDRKPVGNLVPQVDAEKCTLCGNCGEICQYSAIVCVGKKVLVYPELCHGCGGCGLVCSAEAITEVSREIGVLETGRAGAIRFARGLLDVGQPMSPPLIRAVKSTGFRADLTIVDVPPGTSCPVIEAVRGADFVILVTEPTPFGFHDLKLAVEMVRALKLPFGVVINRAGLDGREIRSYCTAQGIPILQEIPDDRKLAEAYSRGVMACEALPEYESMFAALLRTACTTGSNV